MAEYIIEADHISCKMGYRYLLHDISWQVRPGERWVVFGMNGSGKTTLLSIIAGFQHFTSGSLKLFGQTLDDENILAQRQRIGWVSSSFFDKYYSQEAVLDIVLSAKTGTLGLEETPSLKDRQLAQALLNELHLADKAGHTFDMLSKGERQNVLIARALFSKPDILVLDEPCTGLDVYNREYLFQTLEDLAWHDQMTIIYVTHYVEEIRSVFDKCLLLKNGRQFAQGDTQTIFQDQTLSELLNYPVEVYTDRDQTLRLKVLGVQSHIARFLTD